MGATTETKEQIIVTMPPDELKLARSLAVACGQSLPDVVRRLVRCWMAEQADRDA